MKVCGFVLAAGLGTRLRALFPDLPKPLVPLHDGNPAISMAFSFLLAAGASRIIVNTHHQRDTMRQALPPLLPPSVELVLSEEEVLLGTGGGILKAQPFFHDYDWLIVVNADILADLTPGPIFRVAEKGDSDVHLVLSRNGPSSERGRIGRTASGGVWFRGETREKGTRLGFFLGIHYIRPWVFKGIPLSGQPSIIDLYREMNRRGTRVRTSFTRAFWVDLGTEDGYRRALTHLEERQGKDLRVEG